MNPEAQKAERDLAGKRRQAYHKRRRQIESMSKRGTGLVPSGMTDDALWHHLLNELLGIEDEAKAGSSVKGYAAIRRALDYALEIHQRGVQLQLPIEDSPVPANHYLQD